MRAATLLSALRVAAGGSNDIVENDVAGMWGGECTCPDGQIYWVADEWNECGSLACINGTAGECQSRWDYPPPEWYSGRRVTCETRPPPPPLPPASACDETVAYVFLTRNDLPLWSVWTAYFDTCPAGSAVPIVHSQNAPNTLASRLEVYGGHVLPANETLQGDLRFSFDMVRAQLRLYGAGARATARNCSRAGW